MYPFNAFFFFLTDAKKKCVRQNMLMLASGHEQFQEASCEQEFLNVK